jgi:perosamine synthetase
MAVTRSIPLARAHIGDRERELVLEVLRSDVLALGPMAPAFERAFAERVGTRHAVACSSGTAGLHAALHTVGLEPGDEVITSSYSFVASANVILYERATPVFADIDEHTWNLDPAAVEAAVTPRTRAIIPVDIYGYPCDIEAITAIAGRHGLAVVEDACEALGAEIGGRQLGTHGHPAVFAFYPNKQMTTGEGGMITTDDDAVAAELRSLINQGRGDDGGWLIHDRIGFNYRMDEMSAAVGLAQVEKLDMLLEGRRAVAALYADALRGVDGVRPPYEGDAVRSWFVYPVLLDAAIDRTAVIERLAARGIASRPYLPAIHTQAPYRRLGFHEGMLPVTERISRSTLALPFFVGLGRDDVAHVVATLREVVGGL